MDNVELKFLVKIINKYKRKKSKTLYKKGEEEEKKKSEGIFTASKLPAWNVNPR